jgi:catechol 2,3-dioxygenase-like lactoylglutathione lyase family enzyme
MRRHEIGLFAKDPEASKHFYHHTLGLQLDHEEPGLSVFDSGWPGVEITDPDGLRVFIQSPTEASPDWIKQMVT